MVKFVSIPPIISHFIRCHGPGPFLLGLSGGADSTALFHALISCQASFHVAHVDHRWRKESHDEAMQLKALAEAHGVPFHLHTLAPESLQGNLEAACRHERIAFFKQVCDEHNLSGVMLAHHQGDQTETVLKRVLEGSHWSHLVGLQPVIFLQGLKIYRPLLGVPKKEIYRYLDKIKASYFEDATNQDERYMRARMRQSIIPELNRSFGKEIDTALAFLGEQMAELKAFFEGHLQPILNQAQQTPQNISLSVNLPDSFSLIERKYLLKQMSEKLGVHFSREIFQDAAEAWQQGKHKQFMTASAKMLVSGKRVDIEKVSP